MTTTTHRRIAMRAITTTRTGDGRRTVNDHETTSAENNTAGEEETRLLSRKANHVNADGEDEVLLDVNRLK